MDETKKPEGAAKPEKKEEDRMLVTRAILNEVREALGYTWRYTDEQMLSRMRQMIGGLLASYLTATIAGILL